MACRSSTTPATIPSSRINTKGEVVASYDKSHLVPFGEYLPFQDFFRLFGINQFVPGTNGWAPGDGKRLMSPPGLAAIPGAGLLRGDISRRYRRSRSRPQYILNVTNDAWFDGSIGPAQHAHHARDARGGDRTADAARGQ